MTQTRSRRVFTLSSEADTSSLAEQLSRCLPQQCVVALDGTLGAGKTLFVRAFAASCGIHEKDVTSPTFTLWQTYQGTRRIHHFDAYRIQDEDEFEALGVLECFSEEATTFIEWAERIEGCLPKQHLAMRFEVLGEETRRAHVTALGPTLTDAIQRMAGFDDTVI